MREMTVGIYGLRIKISIQIVMYYEHKNVLDDVSFGVGSIYRQNQGL